MSGLSAIRAPTLYTCGRLDEAMPESTGFSRSQVPGAKPVVFEKRSHLAFLEERDAYLKTLREFLNSAERSRLAA